MKRMIAFAAVFLVLAGLFGCRQQDPIAAPVSFHYLRVPQIDGGILHGAADSLIAPEVREGAGHQNDYTYLLDIYLLGPLDPQFRSPYPVGTYLADFSMDGKAAAVILTDDLAKLSGIDLSLACCCLTLTVMDMTGAESVTISAEDSLLDGKRSITMDRAALILIDGTIPETQ